MYQEHWDLTDRPFPSRVGPSHFFESPTHEEALARLQYLVDQHYRIGLLLGGSGSGKSFLLNMFAQAIACTGRQVALVNLLGLDGQQLALQLATSLEVNVSDEAPPATLWSAVVDRIVANGYQKRDTVLLLDDADEADRPLLAQVARLAECDHSTHSRLTVILSAHSQQVGQLGARLLELAELRISIEPWNADETRDYLHHALSCVGAERTVFGESAVQRLHELTHGVPRRVSQLAELALVAGAGEQKTEIDDETVGAAFEELSMLAANVPSPGPV